MCAALLFLMIGFADTTENLPDDSVMVTFEFVQYETKQQPPDDYHLTVEPAATIEVEAKPGQPFFSRARVGSQKYTCSGTVTRFEDGTIVLRMKATTENGDDFTSYRSTISSTLGETIFVGGGFGESMTQGEDFTTYSGDCLRVKVTKKEPSSMTDDE